MRPALQVLAYIGLALITLRVLLSLFLRLFAPSLGIGRLSPFTVGDIVWTSKLGGERPEERIRIHVGRVGWSVWGSKSCTKGWFVLKLSKVRIIIPRAALLAPPRAPPRRHAPHKSKAKPRSSSIRSILHFIHTRFIRPALDRLSTIASALSSALVLFAIQVDFAVELEGTLKATGVLSGGLEVGGHLTEHTLATSPKDLREIRLGGWISLANLQIHECKSPSAQSPNLPALAMRERLVVSVSAPLGPAGGFAALVSSKGRSFRASRSSVRLKVTFGDGEVGDGEGVHVRIHELKRIVLSAEEVGRERSKMLAKHRPVQREDQDQEYVQSPPRTTPPLHYLRSVELSLPLFVLSAHYHTPLHILAASPKQPLPTSVAFAWTVKNAQGMVTMGGTTDDIAKEHSQFLGRGRALGVGAKLSWEEIEGRIKIDGTEEDILPSSAKAFAIGSSVLHVNSTWLPSSLAELPSDAKPLPPRDFNDQVVIAEGMLGEVRGHATFETLDSALRIFKARPRPDHESVEKTPRAPAPLHGLPRVVGTIASAGVELRIQAPLNSEARDAEEDDHFFRSWTSPELFCISFPNGSVSFASEYTDRSVKRTEVDRRVAKRMARDSPRSKKKMQVEESVEGVQSPTAELERELGVPPPPPITSPPRRHLPTRPEASLSKHLDSQPLRYTATANLVAETLNVYILATNHGNTSAEDAAGWLDEQPVLPSDPIRFDILAIGPLEVSTTQVINGCEGMGAQGTIAVLDRETHRGDINVLVEAIGIDLWRPVVMGSLRDFLTSWASASATSTLRTPSSYPKPKHVPPKPLVETMPVEQCFYVAVASLDLRIAGSDPKNDERACRGVALHSGPLVFEYLLQKALRPGIVNYANRHTLDMREDIRIEANANVAEKDGTRQALLKFSLSNLDLDPVVNARASRGHTRKYSTAVGPGAEGDDEDWELKNRAHISDLVKRRRSIMPSRPKQATKGILNLPHLSVRVRIGAAGQVPVTTGAEVPLDDIVVSVEGDTLTLRVELFTIYLCLVAISAARSLKPTIFKPSRPTLSTPAEYKRPAPLLSFRLQISDFNIFPTLPHNVPLFAHFRRIRIQQSKALGVLAEWDMFLLAGESPTAHGKWDDIIRLRVSTVAIRPEPNNSGYHSFVVAISSESARLRIPFRYVFSRIVDNAANLIKAVKQLVHQHIKGGFEFVLEPRVEEAKRLPKIEIKIRMFAIEIQDDPFETRLNIIWRAGYEEQSARIERDAAFEAKVEAIRRAENAGGEDESSDDEAGDGHHRSARKPKVSGRHSVPIDEARRDLRAYNSSHWVKRMRNAVAEQGRREEAVTRRLYGPKHNSQRPDSLLPIDLLPASRSAPLARATLQDITFTLSRPSFPDEDLSSFMHDVGRGLPHDSKFSLLVPLHFSWKMDTVLVRLRDYPLPLLHIPGMPQGGGHEFASWECEADLVIGEEMGGPDSVRRVPCEVVPAHAARGGTGRLYSIVVPRSAMPVKTYCVPTVRVRTPFATRIGWGNSVAPAIQDVAKVLDTLSKATPDPSERIGFWDKLRLQFHWRVQILFQGEGPVHFHLKGARDPYALTGFGAGFAKSWHGNVRFLIGLDNVDREVIQIISDEYVLGIPNLRQYVDNAATGMANRDPAEGNDGSTQHSNATGDPLSRSRAMEYEFTKVCAKLINGVRWGIGAVLERACLPSCDKTLCREHSAFHRHCRFFDFRPHWAVHTKTDASIGPHGEIDDSFAGFRSDFIHFSISLTSPLTLPLPSHNSSPVDACEYDGRDGYNSMHFSPHANTHFARWWKLFDSTMSIPIRQGKLFPSAQAPSKKFGKHCATIKYRFSLAPLFISHTYKQETWAEWIKGETTVLGVKGKIGRFNVDLHQREQEETVLHPDTGVKKTIHRKAFYMAEVDCDGVDLRAITACFQEPEKSVVVPEDVDEEGDEPELPSMHDYTVADEDLDWVDMDDFNDAVYTIPDRNPQLRVLPFIVCPRFTYYRQIDVAGKPTAEENEEDEEGGHTAEESTTAAPKAKTKFGNEPSHTCLMGTATDTITVQIESAEARLAELERELRKSSESTTDKARNEIELRIRALKRIIERLCQVRDGLARAAHEDGTDDLEASAYDAKAPKPDPPYGSAPHTPAVDDSVQDSAHLPHITSTLYQEWGKWENRYMVHNPQIQVTNITREVLLKYYYSSTDRRGFVYYLSASAIKFIRDLAKERDQSSRRNWSRRKSTRTGSSRRTPAFEETQATNRLLDELLDRGGGSFWANNESADDGRHSFGDALDVDPENAAENLPEHFDLNSGHLCMFIKPQISLRSDVDDKSTVILTAFRAQLKVFSVVDVRILDDPVNAEVLHQTFATVDGLQAFYPHLSKSGVTNKTAFVPLETLVDLRVEPWGFDRVVPRTSAALRYDKFNQLRLSSKSTSIDTGGIDTHGPQTSHFHTGTDRVSVECDKFSVSANPEHFAAIYNVVTDLLLYSDPARKSRNVKLESVVFTHNFSDLLGVANIIRDLQQRIRAELYLQQLYQVHLDELDEEGRIALFVSRSESTRLSIELSLVIEAITKAQNINGASKVSGPAAGVQFEARASELVYHMLDRNDVPFSKFSVNGVEFSWISKQDSSVSNRLVIKDLKALNSSPEHVFAEIISKNTSVTDHELSKVDVFAAILWNALPPVGGISIVEQFEVHLHPIRLQLEHRVGRQILDYLFVQRRQQQDEDDSPEESNRKEQASLSTSPQLRPPSVVYPDNKSVESLIPRTHRPRSMLAGDDRSFTPNRSTSNLHSSAASVASNEHRLRKAASTEVLAPAAQEEGLDADEMRQRASLNKTFILVDFTSTVLCLTYRSEKEDHSSLPNIYNITYKTPSIQYRSKTWSYLDLLNELKKDTIKSVWSQKGALLGQLLQTAHRRLPLTDARAAAKRSLKSSIRARLSLKSSRPSSTVEPVKTSPLARNSSTDPYSRPTPQRTPSSGSSSVDLSEPEDEEPEAVIPSPRSPRTRTALDSLDDLVSSAYVAEPEEMSIHSTLADASSGSRSPVDSEAEAHSLPLPRHRKLSELSGPKHSASLPPSPARTGSVSTDPLTQQARRGTLTPLSAEEKARLLMGKSFE